MVTTDKNTFFTKTPGTWGRHKFVYMWHHIVPFSTPSNVFLYLTMSWKDSPNAFIQFYLKWFRGFQPEIRLVFLDSNSTYQNTISHKALTYNRPFTVMYIFATGSNMSVYIMMLILYRHIHLLRWPLWDAHPLISLAPMRRDCNFALVII